MAVITTIVAIAAVLISAMQWLTAKQKIAVDALENRLEIYEDIVSMVAEFSGSGNFPVELHKRFIQTMRRARFYFGPEVDEYLDTLRLAMHRGDGSLGFRQNLSEEEFVNVFDMVDESFETLDRMFVPYMRNDQRMPLAWWSSWKQQIGSNRSDLRRRVASVGKKPKGQSGPWGSK
ncbi:MULTISPECIES: hypothetical protein [unclassified Bradyrhizobium]|uniref:hypothetical protein n=1 Tax=Bradyrhizobium TaxID=374 RepID=UPI002915DC5B|nr:MULTISPECIES: hypothetical protein [unclassified Bradyrhizobium]